MIHGDWKASFEYQHLLGGVSFAAATVFATVFAAAKAPRLNGRGLMRC
jgi:hypothetical protein